MTQAGVSSDEIAFLAGDERIEIEPKIKLSSLSLISVSHCPLCCSCCLLSQQQQPPSCAMSLAP